MARQATKAQVLAANRKARDKVKKEVAKKLLLKGYHYLDLPVELKVKIAKRFSIAKYDFDQIKNTIDDLAKGSFDVHVLHEFLTQHGLIKGMNVRYSRDKLYVKLDTTKRGDGLLDAMYGKNCIAPFKPESILDVGTLHRLAKFNTRGEICTSVKRKENTSWIKWNSGCK